MDVFWGQTRYHKETLCDKDFAEQVNFLVQFASKPLFYRGTTPADPRIIQKSLSLDKELTN